MSFEGKIITRVLGAYRASCTRCSGQIDIPKESILHSEGYSYSVASYLNTPYFIYTSQKGGYVTYCSKYCRNKHNHRYTKVKDAD